MSRRMQNSIITKSYSRNVIGNSEYSTKQNSKVLLVHVNILFYENPVFMNILFA